MNLVSLLAIVLVAGLLAFGVSYLGNEKEGAPTLSNNYLNAIEDAENVVEKIEERHGEEGASENAPSGTRLDLGGQGLESVPGYVFERTELTELDVSNNALDGALQAEVRHLQNLRVLDLSDNDFTGVPAEVGQLSKLEVLDLSNNPITGLPYEIGNLKNLKVLDLRGTNYAEQDLSIIREGLPTNVEIRTD